MDGRARVIIEGPDVPKQRGEVLSFQFLSQTASLWARMRRRQNPELLDRPKRGPQGQMPQRANLRAPTRLEQQIVASPLPKEAVDEEVMQDVSMEDLL